MKRVTYLAGFGLVFFISSRAWCAPAQSAATITSDELEMRDNGAKTFFRGHVVLKEAPYRLDADQMIRTKLTGLVNVYGHLDGTWLSDKGEKVKAYGDEGFYNPAVPMTEFWGKDARLIRWETARDTEPVQITADRFQAFNLERQFYALGHAVITQAPKLLTRSDKAHFDQIVQIVYLYGPSRVFVHIADAKGTGDFTGDKGWVTLDPKTAHMAGHVIGHIDPGKTL